MLIFRLNFEIFSFQLLYFIMDLISSVGGKNNPFPNISGKYIAHSTNVACNNSTLEENLLHFESEMGLLVLSKPGELMYPLPHCATASPDSL